MVHETKNVTCQYIFSQPTNATVCQQRCYIVCLLCVPCSLSSVTFALDSTALHSVSQEPGSPLNNRQVMCFGMFFDIFFPLTFFLVFFKESISLCRWQCKDKFVKVTSQSIDKRVFRSSVRLLWLPCGDPATRRFRYLFFLFLFLFSGSLPLATPTLVICHIWLMHPVS